MKSDNLQNSALHFKATKILNEIHSKIMTFQIHFPFEVVKTLHVSNQIMISG